MLWYLPALAVSVGAMIIVAQFGLMYLEQKLPRRVSFHVRMERLTERLTHVSEDADTLLREMSQLTRERSEKLKTIEMQIEELSRREEKAKLQLVALETVRPEALERFSEMLEEGEQRTKMRDYIMMGGGVVLTTVITVGLKLLGLV